METAERKPFLLRIDSDLYAALARWADDDLRSLNGQIEFLLNRSLEEAGRSSTSPRPRPVKGPIARRREPAAAAAAVLRHASPRPAARKATGTRPRARPSASAGLRSEHVAGARGHEPVTPPAPAPLPAPRASAIEVPPARKPVDDWDAMVD